MAKTRLNKGHRDLLIDLAYEKILLNNTPIKKKYTKLNEEMRNTIIRLHSEQFPPEDLEVLKKYELTSVVSNIRIHIIASYESEEVCDRAYFELPEPHVLELPNSYYRSLPVDIVNKSKEHSQLIAYDKAKNNRNDEIRDKKLLYEELIVAARYYEDLIENWTEAAELSNRIRTTALVAINPEKIAEVKRDVLDRTKLEK